MVKKLITILILLIIGIGGYFYFFYESEETKIKETINSLVDNASRSLGQKNTVTLLKYQRLQKVFTEQCYLEIGVSSFDGKYTSLSIANAINNVNMLVASSKFYAKDLIIDIIDDNNAMVTFTGEGNIITKGNEKHSDVRVLIAKLVKIDGEWKINSIKVEEVLKK